MNAHTHTHSFSIMHSLITPSLSHTYTVSPSYAGTNLRPLSLTHTHTHTRTHTHTHVREHARSQTYTNSLAHTHTHILFLSHTPIICWQGHWDLGAYRWYIIGTTQQITDGMLAWEWFRKNTASQSQKHTNTFFASKFENCSGLTAKTICSSKEQKLNCMNGTSTQIPAYVLMSLANK